MKAARTRCSGSIRLIEINGYVSVELVYLLDPGSSLSLGVVAAWGFLSLAGKALVKEPSNEKARRTVIIWSLREMIIMDTRVYEDSEGLIESVQVSGL